MNKISVNLKLQLTKKAEAIEKMATDNPTVQALANEIWELLWDAEDIAVKK